MNNRLVSWPLGPDFYEVCTQSSKAWAGLARTRATRQAGGGICAHCEGKKGQSPEPATLYYGTSRFTYLVPSGCSVPPAGLGGC